MPKNNMLSKLLDENILRKFSNICLQNNIIGGLTRQPCKNLENLHESSPPLCQNFNTLMLNRNTSVNKLERENEMKIAQNKKINDQLMGIRNSRHQEYMLNSNMSITDCDKNKDDTAIHGTINNKEANESTVDSLINGHAN